MKTHFGFDRQQQIVLAILEGDFGDEDLRQFFACMEVHARSLRPSAVIIDFSTARVQLSGDGIWSAARMPSPYAEPIPRFLIAPDLHVFGLARMYQMMRGDPPDSLHVVRTADEALEMLGVPHPLFEPISPDPALNNLTSPGDEETAALEKFNLN